MVEICLSRVDLEKKTGGGVGGEMKPLPAAGYL